MRKAAQGRGENGADLAAVQLLCYNQAGALAETACDAKARKGRNVGSGDRPHGEERRDIAVSVPVQQDWGREFVGGKAEPGRGLARKCGKALGTDPLYPEDWEPMEQLREEGRL